MLFTKDITVTANTAKASPKEEKIKIAHGVITWLYVSFPPGCNNMVHCVLRHREHQMAPSTEGMTLIGNGVTLGFPDHEEIYQPPYSVKVQLWSPGTSEL